MMQSVNNSFFADIKSFASNHQVLCVLTLGLAIAAYSLGNLAGKAIAWMSECKGTTKKADIIGCKIISTLSNLPFEPLIAKSADQLSIVSSQKIEEFIENLKNENGLKIEGSALDTWHEIIFDNKPYEKSKVKCSWKLHISSGSDTMVMLNAIKPVLLKNRPYCKIVQSQEKLVNLENSRDVNGKYVYKGKCLTIYPKSEQEALILAIELNEAINTSNLINNDKKNSRVQIVL